MSKKVILSMLLSALAVLLIACGSAASSDASASASGTPVANAALSPVMQLALGTLELEGTENAVTAEQAAALLPLWQAYNSLSASDTAAQAEIDALVAQIQETMSAEQTQAIADMQLTMESMRTLMQELGLSMGPGGGMNAQGTPVAVGAGTPFPDMRGDFPSDGAQPGGGQAPGGGGVPPSGGFPGGGGGFSGGGSSIPGEGIDPVAIATMQASGQSPRQGFGQGNTLNPVLFNALIELLQEKIEGEG